MTDERINLLISTVKKLHSRGAKTNIQKVFVKTHTADIALILEAFTHNERVELFLLEPSLENRAKILSHLDIEIQKKLLEELNNELVSKLVSLMDSDDAADLLGELSEEASSKILSEMDMEDSDDVADLLSYPEDSAGGLMDSDYFSLNFEITVEEAIQAIQKEENESRILFYIYITNESQSLIGVLSLKQLLLSRKSEKLKDIMNTTVISVPLDMPQAEVAKIVERYDFLSIPVVDGSNRLEGVITVDDVIDVIREEAEEDLLSMGQAGLDTSASVQEHFKARIPWVIFSFIGGLVSFCIVYFVKVSLSPQDSWMGLWGVIGFLPLFLSLGSTVGNQTSTIIVSAIISGKIDQGKVKTFFKKEFVIGLLMSFILFIMTFVFSYFIFNSYKVSVFVSAILFIQVMISTIFGGVIPFGVNKLGKEAALNVIPVFNLLAELTSLLLVIFVFLFKF